MAMTDREIKDTPPASGGQGVAEEGSAVMSVGQLMVLRFKHNRLAMIALILLAIMYFVTIFAGFFAPYYVRTTHSKHSAVGPNPMHIRDKEGNLHWPPFVYGYETTLDPETYQRVGRRTEDMYPVRFFGRGDTYTILGVIEWDRHLFVVDDPGKIFMIGTDSLGRDLFSRIIYGAQVSLSVGLVGVFLSLIIGSFVGVMSGYYGGAFDNVTMRIVEVLMAFPTIPLWMALASALPPGLDSIKVYFGITVILSIINWGGWPASSGPRCWPSGRGISSWPRGLSTAATCASWPGICSPIPSAT